jgi:cell division septal protein FtsQ
LFPLPQKEVDKQLTDFPQVKSARLYRRLPSTLVVGIILHKPLGTIGSQVLGVKAIADTEGEVFQMQVNDQLPQLLVPNGSDTPKPGQKLSPPQLRALHILSTISKITSSRVLGRQDRSRLEIALSDATLVVVDLDYLPSNWDTTLHLILDRSKIQSKVPKTIDLRFSSPILKY